MRQKLTIDFENTEAEMLTGKSRWAEWIFNAVDFEGDVSIHYNDGQSNDTLFLDQYEIKQLIAFLQRQVKNK